MLLFAVWDQYTVPYRERGRLPHQRADALELLNESLSFGLDHARSVISEWVEDFNTARPHSSLSYQTPAAFDGLLAATANPVAQHAPQGVTETVEALIAAG